MGINVKDARWPGCSAENFGRFIPCRGGGTATTYYTDWHDVDEETRTAIARGGYWCRENEDGVTRLNLDGWNTPTTTQDIVASRLIYLS